MMFEETEYGFKWGPVSVERLCSGEPGWCTIEVRSERECLQIYTTKTGKFRIMGRRLKGKERFFRDYKPEKRT